MPESQSRPRTPNRPTTPLRPSSRSSLRDSARESLHGGPNGSSSTFPLNAFEPAFAELSDAMADLEANMMHFQLMHESLARFSEDFASFLYGLNMNAFCVDFPEGPLGESFRRQREREEREAAMGMGQQGQGGGNMEGMVATVKQEGGERFEGNETTFMTTDTSFVDNPTSNISGPTPRKPSVAPKTPAPRQSRVPAPSGTTRGTSGRGAAGRGVTPASRTTSRGAITRTTSYGRTGGRGVK
ncbi:DASH complex subunit Dam1-domain-containing protein [Sordaria brevicollis]|uniref:DASH complex subunit DAM1 n=1 Tax=Sordaria brevicollis TaxID=83679 RepID=A0AAE0NVY1_SORBR|nr:DASH complex subunit Dam1-domain-containing protein [Sordaria brevicollis]